ncbi:unnamed protein product [Urochloa humidicola]
MDAMDEFQEADILWPDTEDELAPFATTDNMVVEEEAVSSVAPAALGRRRFEGLFVPGAAGTSSSAGASPDSDEDDEEEWQEADVLWPDTMSAVSRGGLLWPFPGGSGRAGRGVNHPAAAAARHDRWRPAASSPIDIPATNAAARRRVNLGRR